MSGASYIAYHFEVKPLQPATNILIAQLGEAGFESFVETPQGLSAFIQEPDWDVGILDRIQILQTEEFEISYRKEEIAQTNWNAAWEKDFHPIVVDELCTVRAPFHEVPKTKYDIVIEPKMSFGTGHHETTHMMLSHMLQVDFNGKTVLDMGCGTGILAIFAEMLGAKNIDAIDIDAWCYENSIENARRNGCERINVLHGDVSLLDTQLYDVVLANINRNILLSDLPVYVDRLRENGLLVLSGFYDLDLPLLVSKCTELGLEMQERLSKNDWVAVSFKFV